MKEIRKKFQYGQHEVTIKTGCIARQATGSVMINMGDTTVLVTVVGKQDTDNQRDFFPLTVNYQERTYSAGRIPGGYFKREGRPSEKETLTARLIDRPIRPLFPKGFMNEVQVVATVVSLDRNIDADIVAMLGTSAALAISGIPFEGPIGAARVGYDNNEYVLNPTYTPTEVVPLNMVVAGTQDAVLMVESEAQELSEAVMLGAVMYGHQQMQTAIQAINELAAEVGTERWNWEPKPVDTELQQKVATQAETSLGDAYLIQDKMQRQAEIANVKEATLAALLDESAEDVAKQEAAILGFVGDLEKSIVRGRILKGEPRIDGRDTKTVRPITIEVGVLPRTHGSALFTRGETQALVVTTLGTGRDAQLIDAIEGEYRQNFMLHYNFPPYCVGETGMIGSPKRREIGHGRLAKRGVQAVLPDMETFPYVLRVVSEITESNGSSSMASVCGSCLSLMDAGVPISAPVAGIAMGLIKEEQGYAVLTDILGDEDHLGDMDFKVAGTANGVTALQMDIKINGITQEIMQTALDQALEARLHILSIMNKAIDKPRTEMSAFAPRIVSFKIPSDKIRDIIGKGGATIRSLTEETGTTIDIDDNGVISIAAVDQAGSDEARRRIDEIIMEFEVGQVYEGSVVKITDFGAFVRVAPGKEGLVHISQIAHERIKQVSDVLAEGQEVRVKVIEIDRQGRVRLSIKEAMTEEA